MTAAVVSALVFSACTGSARSPIPIVVHVKSPSPGTMDWPDASLLAQPGCQKQVGFGYHLVRRGRDWLLYRVTCGDGSFRIVKIVMSPQ